MKTERFVRLCGWCGKGLDPWAKIMAFLGWWPVSHGICPGCEVEAQAQVDEALGTTGMGGAG